MTTRGIRWRNSLPVALLLANALALLLTVSPRSSAQKLKPEDVVNRHLESIGSAKERAAVRTRIISGTSQVVFHTTPVGQAVGRAVLASEDVKSLLGMSFPSPVYPREQLGFNGIRSAAHLQDQFDHGYGRGNFFDGLDYQANSIYAQRENRSNLVQH